MPKPNFAGPVQGYHSPSSLINYSTVGDEEGKEDTEVVEGDEYEEDEEVAEDDENDESDESVEGDEDAESSENPESAELTALKNELIELKAEMRRLYKEEQKEPEETFEEDTSPYFSGDAEELEELITSPEKFNRFLGETKQRMEETIARSMAIRLSKTLPGLIDSSVKATSGTQKKLAAFYENNPHLQNKKMKAVVENHIKVSIDSGKSLDETLNSTAEAFSQLKRPVKKVKKVKGQSKRPMSKRVKRSTASRTEVEKFAAALLGRGV